MTMKHFMLQNKKAEESDKLLFVDSEAVITQYYLGMYFNKEVSPLIEEIIKLQNYDLVIFLEPDIPWVGDGLRFLGEDKMRIECNEKLKKMFKDRGIQFVSVSGDYINRFNKTKELVDELIKK